LINKKIEVLSMRFFTDRKKALPHFKHGVFYKGLLIAAINYFLYRK